MKEYDNREIVIRKLMTGSPESKAHSSVLYKCCIISITPTNDNKTCVVIRFLDDDIGKLFKDYHGAYLKKIGSIERADNYFWVYAYRFDALDNVKELLDTFLREWVDG